MKRALLVAAALLVATMTAHVLVPAPIDPVAWQPDQAVPIPSNTTLREATLREAQLQQRERETGQQSLFGGEGPEGRSVPPLPRVPEWSEAER